MSKKNRYMPPPTVTAKPTATTMAPTVTAPSPVSVPAPAVFGSDAAPVIYFDGVVAFGVRDGVVQLELATNQLVPVSLEGTKVKTKVVVVAHLRCTASTAADMMELIEKMVTAAPPPPQTN